MATTLSHDVRSRGSLIAAVNSARGLLERFPTSLLALAFRLAVATVFWRSGLTKIASWDATIALFDMEYMLPILPPAVGAYLATTVELGCSALLALGLATRFAAAALLGMTLVIQLFVYPENWPDHLLWGSILAYLGDARCGGDLFGSGHLPTVVRLAVMTLSQRWRSDIGDRGRRPRQPTRMDNTDEFIRE